MAMIYLDDLADFSPWSGAIETWDIICDNGALDDLERYLDEIYGETGISVTQLNDLLRFEADEVLGYLGLSAEEGDIEESTRFKKTPVTASQGRYNGDVGEEFEDFIDSLVFDSEKSGLKCIVDHAYGDTKSGYAEIKFKDGNSTISKFIVSYDDAAVGVVRAYQEYPVETSFYGKNFNFPLLADEVMNEVLRLASYDDVTASRSTKRRFTVTAAKMSDDPDSWKEIEQILKAYEGKKKNPKTGWSGTITIKRNDKEAKEWANDDDGVAWLWDVIGTGDGGSSTSTDFIVYYPATMDGGQKFVIYPAHGMPSTTKNLSEFKKALRSEYSYLR